MTQAGLEGVLAKASLLRHVSMRPMALAEITKQLALQAIGNATAPSPAQPEHLGTAILGQIQAMQKALKEDQELLVLCHAASETVRVLEFYVPSWQVFILTGLDSNRNVTRVIAPAESLQLVCKVIKAPGTPPNRIVFKIPKSS